MSDYRFGEMLEQLLERTREGKVKWHASDSDPQRFTVNMSERVREVVMGPVFGDPKELPATFWVRRVCAEDIVVKEGEGMFALLAKLYAETRRSVIEQDDTMGEIERYLADPVKATQERREPRDWGGVVMLSVFVSALVTIVVTTLLS